MKALDVSIHTRKDSIYVGEANQIVKTMTLTESHPMVDLLDFGPEGFIGNFDTSLSLDEVRIDNTNNVRDRNLIPVHSADSQAVRSDKRENDVPSPNFSKMSSNCFLGSSPASSLPSSSVLPSLVAESTNDGTTRSVINDGRTMGLPCSGGDGLNGGGALVVPCDEGDASRDQHAPRSYKDGPQRQLDAHFAPPTPRGGGADGRHSGGAGHNSNAVTVASEHGSHIVESTEPHEQTRAPAGVAAERLGHIRSESVYGCSDDQGVEAHSSGQGDERHQGLEPHESHRAPEALCAGRIRLNGDDRGSQEAPPSWMAAVNPSGIQSGCSDAGDQGEGNDGLLFYDCEEQDNDLLWKGH